MRSDVDRLRFRGQRPEPRRLWIAYRPTSWPGASQPWIDLSRLGLGRAGSAEPALPDAEELARLDDLVYLPPVAPSAARWRDRLRERLAAVGAICLWQAAPEEPVAAGCETVWDLTEPLLSGRLERLAAAGGGTAAVWPWLPGITDGESLWRPGLDRLAEAGAKRVLPLSLDLAPRERRRLAEIAQPSDYAELFHRAAKPTAAFAAAARRRGLETLWDRPLPAAPRRLATTRAVAGHLAQIGELELAVGGSEVEAQAFFRAARRLEKETLDLKSLLREGNLGILGWLEEPARSAVAEYLGRGGSRAFDERRERRVEADSDASS